MEVIEYNSEPTIGQFHMDESPVRGLMGPFGSGKSVGCCMEIMRRAYAQEPDKRGVRRTKFAAIRNTQSTLKSTTIKTWQMWVPESICPINWGPPPVGRIKKRPVGDGTYIDMEIEFLALNLQKDVMRLDSLELTGAWVNEARHIDLIHVKTLKKRVGRFPPKKGTWGVSLTWSGMFMDTNPPPYDHWWPRMFDVEKVEGWKQHIQPPALLRQPDKTWLANPLAENVDNQPLGYEYWFGMIPGATNDEIRVTVEGFYANTFSGRPVYESEFSDYVHCSDEPLKVFRGMPLCFGWDFGLTPACLVGQVAPNGQLRILREYVCTDGGLRQFVQNVVTPGLARDFPNMTVKGSWADPAGAQRAQADDTITCIGTLVSMGYETYPAPVPNNDFVIRRSAVIDYLSRMIDGQPGIIIDPSCQMLKLGFQGGYKFSRIQIPGYEKYKTEPEKNEYSHIHDGLQYMCVGLANPVHVESVHPYAEPEIQTGGYGAV